VVAHRLGADPVRGERCASGPRAKHAVDQPPHVGRSYAIVRFPYSGKSVHYVPPDGTYCATIKWKAVTEDWCRAVYRLNDALYLGPRNLKSGASQGGIMKCGEDLGLMSAPKEMTKQRHRSTQK
jgi:hypothetical protein